MTQMLKTLDVKEMGRRVRLRREEKGLSREMVAEKLNVTAQSIANIESGKKGVSVKRLHLLCQVLDVPADYILAGSTDDSYEKDPSEIACEEIMAFLHKCDAAQLEGIVKIAKIYSDGVRMK